MNLKPLFSNVIIKPVTDETITKLGLVIPDTVSKEAPDKGEIVAVGTGRILDNGTIMPLVVKVGDKVMFKSFRPTEIKVEGQDYLIVKEDDITAIVE